jgi:hypothetical protein
MKVRDDKIILMKNERAAQAKKMVLFFILLILKLLSPYNLKVKENLLITFLYSATWQSMVKKV